MKLVKIMDVNTTEETAIKLTMHASALQSAIANGELSKVAALYSSALFQLQADFATNKISFKEFISRTQKLSIPFILATSF